MVKGKGGWFQLIDFDEIEWKTISVPGEPVSVKSFMIYKKKFSEGQHASPPAGYPENPDEYAVPHFFMFPIDTAKRVRSALAYFNKHEWKPEEHKNNAARRILRAAKKFGINVNENDEVYRAAHKRKKRAVKDDIGPSFSQNQWEPTFSVNG